MILQNKIALCPGQWVASSIAVQQFTCYKCGFSNAVGSLSCINCNESFYTICPHCNNWVGKYLSYCPVCLRAIYPPLNNSLFQIKYPGNSRSGKKRSIGIISAVLVVCAVLIVGLDLALNRPVPSLPTNGEYETSASQNAAGHFSGQPISAHTLSPVPDTTPTPISNVADSSISVAGQDIEVEYNLPEDSIDAGSDSGSGTKYVDTYLQENFPNWGHCSGGSCRGGCCY